MALSCAWLVLLPLGVAVWLALVRLLLRFHGIKRVVHQTLLLTSAASLFYLRHIRSCAAASSGGKSTSSAASSSFEGDRGGNANGGAPEPASLWATVDSELVKEWNFEVTIVELASCALLADDLHAWWSGGEVAMLPLLLAIVALRTVMLQVHLQSILACRCLSALTVYCLSDVACWAVLAFLFPTFGKRGLSPAGAGPCADGGAAEPAAVVEFFSVTDVIALVETLPSTNVEVQRILDAARCLEGPPSRAKQKLIRGMCGAFQVKRQAKTEKGWRDRPLEDLKRDLQASVLREARNLVHSAALERPADGLAGGIAEPASSSSGARPSASSVGAQHASGVASEHAAEGQGDDARSGGKRASMEGTVESEPQKQRRATEPSASKPGLEEPHEADAAGVTGEAKDVLAPPQPAAEAQGEGAPRSGSLSKRSASSARAAALDIEEPARKDARRARAAGPAAAAWKGGGGGRGGGGGEGGGGGGGGQG